MGTLPSLGYVVSDWEFQLWELYHCLGVLFQTGSSSCGNSTIAWVYCLRLWDLSMRLLHQQNHVLDASSHQTLSRSAGECLFNGKCSV